jgi:hypothetical protein
MVNITPSGGRGISVNPEGIDYPFVDPAEDVRGILADAFVAHEVYTVTLPLRLVQMTHFDAALPGSSCSSVSCSSAASDCSRANVVITDSIGTIICNTALVSDSGYRRVDFGTRFRIHEWIQEEDAGVNKAFICRIVQHTAFDDEEDVYCVPHQIYPEKPELDERVSHLLPKRVRSLTVNTQKFRGPVQLKSGYNINLTHGDDTRIVSTSFIPSIRRPPQVLPFDTSFQFRQTNRITLSANAGDGLGVFPDCAEATPTIIQRINGVSPQGGVTVEGRPLTNAGNFSLAAEECYYVREPTTLLNGQVIPRDDLVPTDPPFTEASGPGVFDGFPSAGTRGLKIGNDCGPCCECVEFYNTYQALRNKWAAFKDLGTRAQRVRDQFKENMERWVAAKTCRESTPLRLAVAQSFGSGTLALSAAGAICNATDECITDVELEICFSCVDDSGSGVLVTPVPGPRSCNTNISTTSSRTRQPYQPEGPWPCYTFHWDEVDPGRAVNFKMQLAFNCDDLCTPLRVTLTGTIGGEPLDQVLTQNIVIICGECE